MHAYIFQCFAIPLLLFDVIITDPTFNVAALNTHTTVSTTRCSLTSYIPDLDYLLLRSGNWGPKYIEFVEIRGGFCRKSGRSAVLVLTRCVHESLSRVVASSSFHLLIQPLYLNWCGKHNERLDQKVEIRYNSWETLMHVAVTEAALRPGFQQKTLVLQRSEWTWVLNFQRNGEFEQNQPLSYNFCRILSIDLRFPDNLVMTIQNVRRSK